MTLIPQALFASAVSQYARFRSGYPAIEVDLLATQVGLDVDRTAVDIGCGTGQLTLPLARRAGRVVAIDPLEDMLTLGAETARAAGLTNIFWVQGDSSALRDLVQPGAHVATFAASFHWMDRPAVLESLDSVLASGGSVVVIDDDLLDDSEQPDWAHAIADIRARYPGLTAAPGAMTRLPDSHQDVLRASPFSRILDTRWSWTRELTIEEAVGLQLTYSFSTPALLGNRVGDFTSDVRDTLHALYPGGTVSEPFRVEVSIASRP